MHQDIQTSRKQTDNFHLMDSLEYMRHSLCRSLLSS